MIRFIWRAFKAFVVLLLIAAIALMIIPKELGVTGRSQYPSLPNGCEAVSASEVLDYLGAPITAESFAAQYLPKTAVGSGVGPEEAYVGDPFGNGYYCYPEALTDGINAYLETQNTSLEAHTHKLVPVSEIALHLHLGKPVIVWTTVDDKLAERERSVVWQLDGKEYHPYTNLHAVVVDGIRGFRVHLVDSVNGERWMSLFKFIPIYYSMGLKAVYFTD